MNYQQQLEQYIRDINSGKIAAGMYLKKAVKRFQSDLKRSKDEDFLFEYRPEKADMLCAFSESLKPGDLNGHNLKLLPWQIFVLCNLEGWVHKSDQNRKRFRMAYVELNRKNGKTTGILLPMVLYNFIKYPAAESYIVSSRDDLAEKTFKEVRDIIHADKQMEEVLECRSLAITFKDISEKSRLGFFCDGGKDADGFRPRFVALDEYHAFQSDKMLTSMQYGMRSKKDAQLVMITTADTDTNVPCFEQNLKSKRILNGLQSQEDFFCVIYALDEGDDIHNPKIWQKANPSLYDIIEPSVIQADIDDAELTPHKIPELKAKTFGVWGCGGEKSWISLEKWQKNKDEEVNWDDFKGFECFGGLDIGDVNDLCAYTWKFIKNGKHYYKHRYFIPEATVYERYRKENVNFLHWVETGLITATPGPTVDYSFVADAIIQDCELYKVKALGFDKWHSMDTLRMIEDARPDIQLIEVEQSLKKLSPLTKSYEKTILDGLVVDNNPVQLWCIQNVEVRPDVNNNYKPMKKSKSSTQHIDSVVTSIMAHGLSINPELNTAAVEPIDFDLLKALL